MQNRSFATWGPGFLVLAGRRRLRSFRLHESCAFSSSRSSKQCGGVWKRCSKCNATGWWVWAPIGSMKWRTWFRRHQPLPVRRDIESHILMLELKNNVSFQITSQPNFDHFSGENEIQKKGYSKGMHFSVLYHKRRKVDSLKKLLRLVCLNSLSPTRESVSDWTFEARKVSHF